MKKQLLDSSALHNFGMTFRKEAPELNLQLTASSRLSVSFDSEPTSLEDDERGLVISSPLKIDGKKVQVISELDLQELRFALLFWDRIDCPTNNFLHIGGGPDLDYLIEAKVAQRTFARVRGGGQLGDGVHLAHAETFKHLDNHQPGKWSLGRNTDSVAFEASETEEGRGLLFKLHEAIPVPDREVALPDILDFKLKRRPELIALRCELEDVYQKIKAEPDRALAESTEFNRLERAIEDQIAASKSDGIPIRLGSMTVRLDQKDKVVGVSTAAAAYSQLGAVGAALVGAAATVSISLGVGLKGRTPSSPFEYVSEIDNRLW